MLGESNKALHNHGNCNKQSNCLRMQYLPGASSRTIVLYHLGSVVLKQRRTAYVEWFYQSLKTGKFTSLGTGGILNWIFMDWL